MKVILSLILLFSLTPFSGCVAQHISDKEVNTVRAEFVSNSKKNDINDTELAELKKTVNAEIQFINKHFKVSSPLTFKIGDKDGPLYDPETKEVLIPYDFYTEVKERFTQSDEGLNDDEIIQATEDALIHTIYHEFSHAIITMFELPVLGREEDAADGFANWFLLEFKKRGGLIVLNAAQLFNLESADIEDFEEEDFWGEHSLSDQRYYLTLCHLYGSDPKRFKKLKKRIGFTTDRAELCEEEYELLADSWGQLLIGHLKR